MAFAVGIALVITSCGRASTTQATTAKPSLPPTVFTFASVSGEFIGGGRIATFTPPAAEFRLDGNISSARVTVRSGDEDWDIELAAPTGQVLHVGTYSGAVRAPLQGGSAPGLDVYGDGRGCNSLYGDFVIKQLAQDSLGHLTRLEATFTQHCESVDAPALRGTIKYTPPAASN